MEHDELCLHPKKIQGILNYWDCTYCYLIRRVREADADWLWEDEGQRMNDTTLSYIQNNHTWYINTTESYLSDDYIYKLDDDDLLDVLRSHRVDVGPWIIPLIRQHILQDIVIFDDESGQ